MQEPKDPTPPPPHEVASTPHKPALTQQCRCCCADVTTNRHPAATNPHLQKEPLDTREHRERARGEVRPPVKLAAPRRAAEQCLSRTPSSAKRPAQNTPHVASASAAMLRRRLTACQVILHPPALMRRRAGSRIACVPCRCSRPCDAQWRTMARLSPLTLTRRTAPARLRNNGMAR